MFAPSKLRTSKAQNKLNQKHFGRLPNTIKINTKTKKPKSKAPISGHNHIDIVLLPLELYFSSQYPWRPTRRTSFPAHKNPDTHFVHHLHHLPKWPWKGSWESHLLTLPISVNQPMVAQFRFRSLQLVILAREKALEEANLIFHCKLPAPNLWGWVSDSSQIFPIYLLNLQYSVENASSTITTSSLYKVYYYFYMLFLSCNFTTENVVSFLLFLNFVLVCNPNYGNDINVLVERDMMNLCLVYNFTI